MLSVEPYFWARAGRVRRDVAMYNMDAHIPSFAEYSPSTEDSESPYSLQEQSSPQEVLSPPDAQESDDGAMRNQEEDDTRSEPKKRRKRRRKRMLTGVSRQRRAANARERRRIQGVNRAFIELKDTLPVAHLDISKIEILRLASRWIEHLAALLDKDDQIRSSNLTMEKNAEKSPRERTRSACCMVERARDGVYSADYYESYCYEEHRELIQENYLQSSEIQDEPWFLNGAFNNTQPLHHLPRTFTL